MTCHSPRPLGDTVTHYWLALGMARAVGVDLVAEMEAGRLSQADWADLVQSCRGCGWERDGGGCGRWLSFQLPGEADIPDGCVNHATFERLSDAG